MKGILLAGGNGTRLFPMTKCISKHLLPVYDKPMIYYPLSVLLLAGIKNILIISSPSALPLYQKLLGNGEQIGVSLSYIPQEEPKGIAEAFLLGSKFIGNDSVCMILGDNIFYGHDLTNILTKVKSENKGASVFGYTVKNPTNFGVVELDYLGNPISLEEKPVNPKSSYAVPGLYFYNNDVVEIAHSIRPSERGELEITSINQMYLSQKKLQVYVLGRGIAWLDTGSPEGLLKAAEYVETVQSRQGFYISCIEEIAWRKHFISDRQLLEIGNELKMTEYGQYLLSLLKE